jgi:NADH dehydrogenase (ubiquinone) Fe-S protein 1
MAPLVGAEAKSVLSSLESLRAAIPNLVTPTWNGINVLQTATSNMAAHDIGFRQGVAPPATPKFVYLLGADEFDESRIPRDAFVVYQGHHGDAGANRANVILAGAAYTEKSGTYVNVEGRVQRSVASANLIAQARPDWAIIRALSEVAGIPLPYDTIDAVRQRLVDVAPHFGSLNRVEAPSFNSSYATGGSAPLPTTPFKPYWDNFFFTNPISRSSRIMARASTQLKTARNSYVATPAATTATARVAA